MPKEKLGKMSEDELVRRMAQHEKNERVWGRICLICFVVGLIGFILSMASAEAGALAVISIPLFIIGFFYFFFIRGRSRDKAISMLNDLSAASHRMAKDMYLIKIF